MTMNIQKQIVREVSLIADDLYPDAQKLGTIAFEALTKDKRSQITGLESLANSTQKVSDVFNYIKTRTARHTAWKDQDFGKKLLAYMENTLAKKHELVLTRINERGITPDRYQQQEIHIMLIRAFIAQLAAQYEFAALENQGK